jgi:type II secretion system protein D
MRIIPLENANAGNLGQMLISLFNQRYQMLRSVDAQRRRPIILPDTRMNALLVAAGVEDSKALDALVEKLDRKPENPAIQVEVLALRHNDAARVSGLLTRFFSGRLTAMTPQGQPIEPQERVTVESDPLSNSLIVSANKENMDMARGLIEQVDKEPTLEGSLVQILPLKNTDAQRAATLLRSLIQQGLYRPGMGGGSQADRRSREAMAVGVDSRANVLIVSASPENMQVIKQVVEHIDSDAFDTEGDIQLFTLQHARASQLSTILEQFFRSKRAAEATANVIDRMVPVTVTADDRTNTLIVTGDRDAFAAVDRMIRQLDVEDVFDRTNFRVFTLRNGTASKLQATLQRLFQNRPARLAGRPADPINIVADSWANALVVSASNEDMTMVASLIETLDAQPADGAMQVRVLPLAKADARSVSQTVLGLYRDSPGAPASVGVNVDERINAIVVSAGEQDMVRIEELVRKLDTDVVARISEIRIFPLRYAQASELAQVLTLALTGRPEQAGAESPSRQSMLQFITRTPEGEQLVSSALKESLLIVSDQRRNALVVSAPLESMNLMSKLIQTLDSEAPQLAKIKMFKLINADAQQMSDLLISLFRLRQVPGQPVNTRAIQYVLELDGGTRGLSATIGSAEQYALTVTVDLRTNALLIGGSDHYVDLATGIIRDLDATPAMERRSVVYRLRNARADEVELALRSFLDQNRQQLTTTLGDEGIGTSQRLLETEVAIVAENTSNSLLLSASPQYFDQFKDLIVELDQPLPQVLIQVILAEVTLDNSMEFGVEWAVSGRRGSTTMGAGTDLGVAQDLQNFGGFSSAVSGNDFGFLMRALQVDGRLEVLSRPQILTADNQLASLDVGQLVPLISGSRVDQFQNVINTFAYTNVGVRLTVTPRISPDGFIRMEVEPVISQLSSATVDVAPGVRAPIINQRTAKTTVSVQSGQSIVIGGLISTSDDQRVRKVPLLGDIPYVGSLFRSTKNIQDRKELIIILTPQLLATGDDARKMSSDQFMRSSIKDQLIRDRLQRQILDPILPFLYEGNTNGLHAVPTPQPPPADSRRRPSARGNL